MFDSTTDQNFSFAGIEQQLGAPLMQLLMAPAIVPGSAPSYELCKTIYSYHPVGAILAEAPIKRAQGQPRIISIPRLGEEHLIDAFDQEWNTLGKLGASVIIANVMALSRVYGISSIGVGDARLDDQSSPLDLAHLDEADLFFNVLDPLNTAGSLVLDQNANSPMYLKQGTLYVNGREWHPSRTVAKMNEQPLFIEWTSSAFGFVGRSVYQRPLFPLKSYLQVMITNDMITKKAGLLIYKSKAPGSFIDNVMQAMWGEKRAALKSGVVNQVASIGTEEDVEAINMEHLEGAFRLARENIVKDIASGAGMPSTLIAQELLQAGLGDGTEDANKEAIYIEGVRAEMAPLYKFMDALVMRKAWTREFYASSIQGRYKDYRNVPYETALFEWKNAFKATWPNPLIEPESERAKMADVQLKAVLAVAEVALPTLDPENKANVLEWLASNVNQRPELFAGSLVIDPDAFTRYLEEQRTAALQAQTQEGEPKPPQPFAARA